MQYTIKFNFNTIKPGRGGSINGKSGSAECDITADFTLKELETKTDDLKAVAFHSIKDNPKIKKMGEILSVEITDIIDR